MCQRQWVKFYCGDLRYAEIRCDENPAGRSFESCATRQLTELSREARGPMGHPDPGLYRSPGSKEWHAANADHLNNVAPNLYHDMASRKSKIRITGRPQKKLKGRLGEVLRFRPQFIADTRLAKP
ncbi:hypothetical protein BPAE_0052g00050 [Botrytis paeoniae]|uniref:Uncharacterized protein n=1 Tax=Botrytis paeoniae TaxID=278948 RepID=A0A4Z1FYF5_9HELO|nr:hypothetical protein BPAE_0052g00050 [Botrytis paeoniae]